MQPGRNCVTENGRKISATERDSMGTIPRVPYKMLASPIPAQKIQKDRTALLLLDFQKYTCDRSSGLGSLAAIRGITPEFDEYYSMVAAAKINSGSLLDVCRKNGVEAIFCYLFKDNNPSQYARQFELSRYPLPAGDLKDEYLAELKPVNDETIVTRVTYSAFLDTGLEEKLRASSKDTLILAGTLYNYTVALAAREAADRGFTVIVVWDASASDTLDWHMITRTWLMGGLILSRQTHEVIEMVEGSRT